MMFLSLTDETYQALSRIREPDESNEDVIIRLIKQHHFIDQFWREQFDDWMEHEVEEAEG